MPTARARASSSALNSSATPFMTGERQVGSDVRKQKPKERNLENVSLWKPKYLQREGRLILQACLLLNFVVLHRLQNGIKVWAVCGVPPKTVFFVQRHKPHAGEANNSIGVLQFSTNRSTDGR